MDSRQAVNLINEIFKGVSYCSVQETKLWQDSSKRHRPKSAYVLKFDNVGPEFQQKKNLINSWCEFAPRSGILADKSKRPNCYYIGPVTLEYLARNFNKIKNLTNSGSFSCVTDEGLKSQVPFSGSFSGITDEGLKLDKVAAKASKHYNYIVSPIIIGRPVTEFIPRTARPQSAMPEYNHNSQRLVTPGGPCSDTFSDSGSDSDEIESTRLVARQSSIR